MTTFHDNLRWCRQQAQLDQATLALCLGVHRCTVSDWECGKYLPTMEHQEALRRVFGDTALLDIKLLAVHEARRR